MEEFVPLVLPYMLAVDEQARVKGLPWELEVALVFLKIERELRSRDLSTFLPQKFAKKISKKRSEIVKISLITKVFCPVWIVPWKTGRGALFDGLGILRQNLNYEELPDVESCALDIKEAKSFDDYLKVIDKHRFTFFTFKSIRNMVMVGLIPYEDFVSGFQSYLTHYRKEEVANALSLNPKVTREQAVGAVEKLLKIEQESTRDLEKLVSVKETLLNQTRYWSLHRTEQIKVAQKDRALSIEKERTDIEARIEKLHLERQSKIADIEKTVNERIKTLRKDQAELPNQLQNLRQQKADYLRSLEESKKQRTVLSEDKAAIESGRSEISAKKSDLQTRLDFLKEEQLKLESSIGAWKGDSKGIATLKDRLLAIRGEIDKINEALLSLNREVHAIESASRDIEISLNQSNRKIESQEKSIGELDTLIQEKESHSTAISRQIEDNRRRIHEEVLKIDKEYRLIIEEQRKQIDALQIEVAKTIAIAQRVVDELTKKTEDIKSQIENLIKQKSDSLSKLQKTTISIPKGLELDNINLVQFPLYLVGLETAGGIQYEFYPPLATKIIRKFPLVKDPLFTLVSSSFDAAFKNELLEAINLNSALEKEIVDGSGVVNLLQSSTVWETLMKGLNELKTMGWISDKRIQQFKASFADQFHIKREALEGTEFL